MKHDDLELKFSIRKNYVKLLKKPAEIALFWIFIKDLRIFPVPFRNVTKIRHFISTLTGLAWSSCQEMDEKAKSFLINSSDVIQSHFDLAPKA